MNKLFLITGSLFSGGAEKRVIELANFFNSTGTKVYLGVLNYDRKYLNKINKNISVINLKIFGKSIYGLVPVIKILYYNFKIDFNVIFSNLYRTNSYLLLIKYFFPNIKIITSIVTDPFIHKNRYLSKFYYLSNIIITNASKNVDHINEYFNVPKNNIIFIPNGVDLNKISILKNEFTPTKKQINPLKFNLLYVGSLRKIKGVDILIRAFALVKEEIDCNLIIVGNGNYEQKLKKYVRQLKIEGHVKFLGEKINPYPYFKFADIFILASRNEGMPNVLLEAMACKLPVISTNTGLGVTDIIQDGFNGIFAKPLDERGLANKILNLYKDKNLIKKFKKNGICLIKEKFRMQQMFEAYYNVFFKA
jgi:glycosyltransferase involved in cell wall biosynthesis